MGNALGGAATARIMKVTGEMIKLSMPVHAGDVVRAYPGHVLLESESVKSLGIKSRPLHLHQELEHDRLYFLVELPDEAASDDKAGGSLLLENKSSATDRLDCLMLARRPVSDLSTTSGATILSKEGDGHGGMRMKMRLPKAEVANLIKESKDEAEVTSKIVEIYVALENASNTNGGSVGRRTIAMEGSKNAMKTCEKRVRFPPVVQDKQGSLASLRTNRAEMVNSHKGPEVCSLLCKFTMD